MIAIRKDKQWPATAKLYLNLQKEWYTNEQLPPERIHLLP